MRTGLPAVETHRTYSLWAQGLHQKQFIHTISYKSLFPSLAMYEGAFHALNYGNGKGTPVTCECDLRSMSFLHALWVAYFSTVTVTEREECSPMLYEPTCYFLDQGLRHSTPIGLLLLLFLLPSLLPQVSSGRLIGRGEDLCKDKRTCFSNMPCFCC